MPIWNLIVIFALLASPAFANDAPCAAWDSPLTLEGYIVDGIFPGPPEYESVKQGDAPFDAQFLYLLEPICVAGPDPMEAEPIAAIELIQLACSETQITAEMRGEIIKVQGTLYSAHTGYHRTAALLKCTQ